jgi:hypothetical protein
LILGDQLTLTFIDLVTGRNLLPQGQISKLTVMNTFQISYSFDAMTSFDGALP